MSVTLIGHMMPELALHEQVLEPVFRDGRQWTIPAEHAAAMAHGVELEVAEGNLFHLAVGGMIGDAVLVAAEAVARLQHRRILIGDARQLVEPAAGEPAEAREVRRKMCVLGGREI